MGHSTCITAFNNACFKPLAQHTGKHAFLLLLPLLMLLRLPSAAPIPFQLCWLQIAKAQGAWVATTCSGRNAAFVTETLGADLAIDYTKQK
jgi:hypothetical protein